LADSGIVILIFGSSGGTCLKLSVSLSSLVLLLAFSASPSSAAQDKIEYLALGDSVAFGLDLAAPPVISSYAGYPEVVSQKAKKQFSGLLNLACPGETSGTFLSPDAPAPQFNNCRNFKAAVGLKTNYIGTQGDYAVELLNSIPHIKLVTIGIGANDLIVLQESCAGQVPCILQNLPATLASFRQNLSTILTRIRNEAHYQRRVLLVTLYSPDYRDPIQTAAISALNAVMLQVAAEFRAQVADGFGGFAEAAAPNGGDACAAGLLLPAVSGCDVHPSPLGRDVLAETVLRLLPGTK
jgi:lysophospholipase L1-like esterase